MSHESSYALASTRHMPELGNKLICLARTVSRRQHSATPISWGITCLVIDMRAQCNQALFSNIPSHSFISTSPTPLLEAVGLHEPHVDRLRERVGHAISQSLIPLLAYCQQYQPYVDLMNLNIKTYIE